MRTSSSSASVVMSFARMCSAHAPSGVSDQYWVGASCARFQRFASLFGRTQNGTSYELYRNATISSAGRVGAGNGNRFAWGSAGTLHATGACQQQELALGGRVVE